MPTGTLKNITIKGIVCTVPDNIVYSESYYDTFGEDNVKKFVNMTGVESRYISLKEQTASDLCFVSAKHLMDALCWDPSSIDAVIFISQTPDYRLPATACVLHKRLGLGKECLAFDINLGCSGYVYGLFTVGSLMQNGVVKRVLLLGGDTISKMVSPEDKSTCMLFGDGGSATALEFSKEPDHVINFMLRTNGEGYKTIIVPSGCYRNCNRTTDRKGMEDGIIRSDYELYMNGMDVFNFTITDVPKTINEFINNFSISLSNIDSLILHQANLFMLKHIAKKVNIPFDKVPITVDKFGNTSVTSIPLTIANTFRDKISQSTKSINLLLSGFGVGLSWGVVSVKLENDTYLSLDYSNEYHTDGGQ